MKIILIGNAEFKKEEKFGSLIDEFEVVVRINRFRLETFVLGKNDRLDSYSGRNNGDGYVYWGDVVGDDNVETGHPGNDLFKDGDYERFIRLVVMDNLDKEGPTAGKLYDSHVGITGFDRKQFVPEFGKDDGDINHYMEGDEQYLLTHTRVPIDFNEWYFIVASYNPMIYDIIDAESSPYPRDSDYWRGNKDVDGNFTDWSGRGAKCKVEIISKSDLLRARGFTPEET